MLASSATGARAAAPWRLRGTGTRLSESALGPQRRCEGEKESVSAKLGSSARPAAGGVLKRESGGAVSGSAQKKENGRGREFVAARPVRPGH